jgi:hypothetical protein
MTLLLPIILTHLVIPLLTAAAGWLVRHVFGPGPVTRVTPAPLPPIQLVTVTAAQVADAITKDGV